MGDVLSRIPMISIILWVRAVCKDGRERERKTFKQSKTVTPPSSSLPPTPYPLGNAERLVQGLSQGRLDLPSRRGTDQPPEFRGTRSLPVWAAPGSTTTPEAPDEGRR